MAEPSEVAFEAAALLSLVACALATPAQKSVGLLGLFQTS